MADPVSALGNARYDGFALVQETGPIGMISLRAAPGTKGLAKAIKAAVGTSVPAQRRIASAGEKSAAWMSPDEFLLLMPYHETDAAMAAIAKAMGAEHHLAAVVSDARAVFDITGPRAAQVLQKLMPVDFAALAPGEVRRSRAAQVAAAVWARPDGFRLVAFRSSASYVMGLLTHSAMPGSELEP